MLLETFPSLLTYGLITLAVLIVMGVAAYIAHRMTQLPPPPFTWPATISLHSFTIKGIIMKLTIHAGKEVPVVIGKPVNKDGTPGEIQDGSLAIVILDEDGNSGEDIASWERDDQAVNPDDPYTGKVVWRAAGEAFLKVTGDADLGDGVETIELVIDLVLLEAEAVGFADPTVGTERDHVDGSAEGSEQAS